MKISKPPSHHRCLSVQATTPTQYQSFRWSRKTKKIYQEKYSSPGLYTVLAVPGAVQELFSPHLPSEDWNYRVFIPASHQHGIQVNYQEICPPVAELYYWHSASSIGGEKLSANQAAGPHICIWMQNSTCPDTPERSTHSAQVNSECC